MEHWQKCNIKPRKRVGACRTIKGAFFCAVRDVDGNLRIVTGEKDLTEKWPTISETGEHVPDRSFGVLAGLNKRNGKISLLSRNIEGYVMQAWIDTEQAIEHIQWQDTSRLAGDGLVLCERCQGGLEAFCTDENNQIWHMWTNRESIWSEWQCLGGPVHTQFAVINNNEGFPQVICLDANGRLMSRRHHNDGMWGNWTDLRLGSVYKFAVSQMYNGAICITALRLDGTVAICTQTEQLDSWTDWSESLVSGISNIVVKLRNGSICIYDKSCRQEFIRLTQAIDNQGWDIQRNSTVDISAFCNSTHDLLGVDHDGYLLREEI